MLVLALPPATGDSATIFYMSFGFLQTVVTQKQMQLRLPVP
jgi:hypothetical protein